ncbi:ankyrin repeat domain-containing protein [Wocania ichthyoenteri]|uniref:ankyrin repeat domain-containing protein n=1 Tax=Wocania ichthyoenteri TaxID=1230531 RepID=UPI00138E15B3|nr:ankyrin repeat domain-containing protein [Wocania ichthyoenteri]
MKIKYFLLILAIIHFSSIFAQNDPFAKIKTSKDATIYLKLISENFKAGDEKLLPILINKGADVNVVNKDNVTPLVSMVFANSTQGVKVLLDAGAKTDIIIPKSYDTPLTLAIRHGVKNKNIQIFDLFLNAKADVNFKNGDGFTPLYASALWGSPVMMAKLIKAGADPNISNSKTPSPLHSAIIKKDFVLAELLLKAGADINLQILNGETPLARAIKFDPSYLAKNINKLIELGADVNLSNNEKKSPLHLATEKNNLPLVQKLLKAGAKVDYQSPDGTTALYIASSFGYADIVKSLLDAKANRELGKRIKNVVTPMTPMMIARKNKHSAITKLLLQSKLNTPLCSGRMKKDDWSVIWNDKKYEIIRTIKDTDCSLNQRFSLWVYRSGEMRLYTSNTWDKYKKIKLFVDGAKIFDGYSKTFNNKKMLERLYKGKTLKIEFWTAKASNKTVYENDLKFKCSASFSLNDFQLVNQMGQQKMQQAARNKLNNNCRH